MHKILVDPKLLQQTLLALEQQQDWYSRACSDAQTTKALRQALAQQPVQDVEISNMGRPFTVKAYTYTQPLSDAHIEEIENECYYQVEHGVQLDTKLFAKRVLAAQLSKESAAWRTVD